MVKPQVANRKPKVANSKKFPDMNKDGKITKADILMGRGVKLTPKAKKEMPKKEMPKKKLTPKQMEKLKEHSKHHSPKHMAMMRKDMKMGMSFTKAHNKAQKAVGK